MTPYYRDSSYVLPKPGSLAESCYKAQTWKVQLAFTEWKKDRWLTSRRDPEEALMNAILSTKQGLHQDVNSEYHEFLGQYLHLLAHNTLDVGSYFLNDPEIVFMEFLVNAQNYQRFMAIGNDSTLLAWMCLSAAEIFTGEPGGDKNHVVSTLTTRLTGNAIVNPTEPTTRTVIDALYGPFAWDLFALEMHADTTKMIKDIKLDVVQPKGSNAATVLVPNDISPDFTS